MSPQSAALEPIGVAQAEALKLTAWPPTLPKNFFQLVKNPSLALSLHPLSRKTSPFPQLDTIMLAVRRAARRTSVGLVLPRLPIRQTARLLTTTSAQTDRVSYLVEYCRIWGGLI